MKRGGKMDELLTLLFMLLAIAAVICFFAMDNRTWFLALGGIAVVLRVIQYVARYFG